MKKWIAKLGFAAALFGAVAALPLSPPLSVHPSAHVVVHWTPDSEVPR